jgi:outer membrane protein
MPRRVMRSLRQICQGAIGLAACLAAVPTVAGAQTRDRDAGPFFVHFGPGGLLFDAGAVVKAAGVTVPGGSVSIDPNTTLIVEFGYCRGNVGVSLTGGIPPRATVDAAGSLAPYGALGRIRYGPMVLTTHYHFTQLGRFQPYLGAGPVFLLIFRAEDGAAHQLAVKNSIGAAVQAGAEYRLRPRWSLFFDAKKAHLRTAATADLGGAPLAARIRLDPLVLAGGLSFHF